MCVCENFCVVKKNQMTVFLKNQINHGFCLETELLSGQ